MFFCLIDYPRDWNYRLVLHILPANKDWRPCLDDVWMHRSPVSLHSGFSRKKVLISPLICQCLVTLALRITILIAGIESPKYQRAMCESTTTSREIQKQMLWSKEHDIKLDEKHPGNCTSVPPDRLNIIPVRVTPVSRLKVLGNQDLYNPLLVTYSV